MHQHTPKPPTPYQYLVLELYQVDTALGKVYRDGKEVGSTTKKYVTITVYTGMKSRLIRRTHIIWWKHHGVWPIQMIDHKDRQKHNDAIENLQYSTSSENNTNKDDRTRASGLPKGVYHDPKTNKEHPYKVVLGRVFKGRYATAQEAIQAKEQAQ